MVDPVVQAMVEGKTFQDIIELTPDEMLSFYNRGLELFEEKRLDDAADLFLFLTTLNPFVYEVWLAFAQVEQANQHWEASFQAFLQAIALKPREPEGYERLIEALKERGETEAAADFLAMKEAL